jgi:hypothetical protein
MPFLSHLAYNVSNPPYLKCSAQPSTTEIFPEAKKLPNMLHRNSAREPATSVAGGLQEWNWRALFKNFPPASSCSPQFCACPFEIVTRKERGALPIKTFLPKSAFAEKPECISGITGNPDDGIDLLIKERLLTIPFSGCSCWPQVVGCCGW